MRVNNFESFDINTTNVYVSFKNKGLGLFLIILTEGSEDVNMPCPDENGFMKISLESLFDVYRLLITKEFGSSVEEIINPIILIDYNDTKIRFDMNNANVMTCLSDNLMRVISHFSFYLTPEENEYVSIKMNKLLELYKLMLYINDKSSILDVIKGNILVDRGYIHENKLFTFKHS